MDLRCIDPRQRTNLSFFLRKRDKVSIDVEDHLFQNFFQPVQNVLVRLEKTLDDFFQIFTGHRIDIEVSFLSFGQKLGVFERRLKCAAKDSDAIFRCAGREAV